MALTCTISALTSGNIVRVIFAEDLPADQTIFLDPTRYAFTSNFNVSVGYSESIDIYRGIKNVGGTAFELTLLALPRGASLSLVFTNEDSSTVTASTTISATINRWCIIPEGFIPGVSNTNLSLETNLNSLFIDNDGTFIVDSDELTIDFSGHNLDYVTESYLSTGTLYPNYIKRIVCDHELYFDGYYVLNFNIDGEIVKTVRFTTKTCRSQYLEVTERPAVYNYITQELANEFPFNSRLRGDRYSHGQTFLNLAFGNEMDEFNRDASSLASDLLPQYANLKQLSMVSTSEFPTFDFAHRYLPTGQVEFVIPNVYGYKDGARFLLTTVSNNTPSSFKDELPKSYYVTKQLHASVDTSTLQMFSLTDYNEEIDFGNYMNAFVLVKNAETLAYLDEQEDERIVIPIMTIKGITDLEIEEEESFAIFYNGVYKTQNKYRIIKQIYFSNISGSTNATEVWITRNPIVLGGELFLDRKFFYSDGRISKIAFWSFEDSQSEDIGDKVCLSVLTADNITQLADYFVETTKKVVTELYDSQNNPLRILSLDADLHQNYFYIIGYPKNSYETDSKIYIFDKREKIVHKDYLMIRQQERQVHYLLDLDIIPAELERDVNGNLDVEVRINSLTPYPDIIATRVSLRGWNTLTETEFFNSYIDLDGSTLVDELSWTEHTSDYLENFSYNLSLNTPGEYALTLEYYNSKGILGSNTRYFVIDTRKPLATYCSPLPSESYVCSAYINGEQDLVLIDQNSDFYEVKELYDKFTIDPQNKIVVSFEQMDGMEISYETVI